MYAIRSPYPQYWDLDGTPLNSGYLYFGTANRDPLSSPVTVYWDAAGKAVAAQPITTTNGYAMRDGTPADIFVNTDYSLKVLNKKKLQVFYKATAVENTGQVLPTINVKDAAFGAVGDGVTDDTFAIQSAISTIANSVNVDSGGGIVYFPAGKYKITGSLLIANSFITLQGSGTQATYLMFANTNKDGLKIQGTTSNIIRDIFVKDMSLVASGKTAGATITANHTYILTIERVSIEFPITGVEIQSCFKTTLRDVYISPNQPLSLYGIYWHCPSDGSSRSDSMTLNNVEIDMNWSDATGIQWSGACARLLANTLRVSNGNYLMRVQNPSLSAIYYPNLCNIQGGSFEGAKTYAISIEAGTDYKFTSCDIANGTASSPSQGNADFHAVVVFPDLGGSLTRGLQFNNCRIGQCRNYGMLIDAKEVQLNNILINSASLSGSNLYSAVYFDSHCSDIQVSNLRGEEYGGAAKASYAVILAAGVTNAQLNNIDANYCVSGAVLDNSGAFGNSNLNTIEPGSIGNGLVSASAYELDFVKTNAASAVRFKVLNNTNNGAGVTTLTLATALANTSADVSLSNNAGSPFVNFSMGSAVQSYKFNLASGLTAFSIGSALPPYANDAAAAAATLPLWGYYWNTTVNAVVQRRV